MPPKISVHPEEFPCSNNDTFGLADFGLVEGWENRDLWDMSSYKNESRRVHRASLCRGVGHIGQGGKVYLLYSQYLVLCGR